MTITWAPITLMRSWLWVVYCRWYRTAAYRWLYALASGDQFLVLRNAYNVTLMVVKNGHHPQLATTFDEEWTVGRGSFVVIKIQVTRNWKQLTAVAVAAAATTAAVAVQCYLLDIIGVSRLGVTASQLRKFPVQSWCACGDSKGKQVAFSQCGIYGMSLVWLNHSFCCFWNFSRWFVGPLSWEKYW